MKGERWKDVLDYKGCYQVSNLGRVRSKGRVVIRQGHYIRVPERILKHSIAKRHGYACVVLAIDGKKKTMYVHRLVLSSWRGLCPTGMESRHKNGNPSDNRLANLHYGTKHDNLMDRRKHGTHGGKAVRRSDGKRFENMHIAAEKTNCHVSGICLTCQGKLKTSGSFGWRYE